MLNIMLIQIPRCLINPKIWRFLCFASSIVGLLCYALSSSFNHLFGKWTWWKIFLYICFCLIICFAILFAKTRQGFYSLRLKAHLAFLVLIITCLYSFFWDQVVKGKPDAYSLISCAAFAIMSLSLSRQSHCGVEIDLLYFFGGNLTVKLMKIKPWLVVFGGSFCYFLIILRSSLDISPLESVHLSFHAQDQVVIEVDSEEINTGSVIQVDSAQADTLTGNSHLSIMPQEPNNTDSAPLIVSSESGDLGLNQGNSTDIGFFRSQLIACIEELKKEDQFVISMVYNHVKDYLTPAVKSKSRNMDPKQQQLHTDVNLVLDALPSGIISNLHEAVKLMVSAGFEKECCHLYGSWRREFLHKCLWKCGWKELDMVDIDLMDKIESWRKAFSVALSILFPSERRLCDRVFSKMSSSADICFTEICRELVIHLLSLVDTLSNETHLPTLLIDAFSKVDKTLSEVLLEFKSQFPEKYIVSIKEELHAARTRMAITNMFVELEIFICRGMKEQASVSHGKLDPIDFQVINCLTDVSKFSDVIRREAFEDFSKVPDRVGKSSFSIKINRIIDLLISNLEIKSKNYTNPTLGYVFMMNNLNYIRQIEAMLGFILASPISEKVQQNLELYKKSSWNKVLDFLKLEDNVSAETMKEKLRLFNLHFQEICNDQSTWNVADEQLRKQIIKAIENILLPAYGNFIGTFQDVVGKQA